MPCHLISDAHEWMNEIPTVPLYYNTKTNQISFLDLVVKKAVV